jgi:hypothetical protein|tara:strand:- start:189 stop:1496 length:1308 start_codon:yes stop_codon:yes gene_type:complete
MAGLITINKLIEMLLQEVRAFDFNTYQQIVLKKTAITKNIRKKRASYADIKALSNEILPQQIKIVAYYAERLPRLERIINILSRGKQRVSKEQKKEYERLLDLLKALVKLGRKKLPSVLEDQQTALRDQNVKKYLKLFQKERLIGFQFVKPLSKLGTGINRKTFRNLSINVKKLILVEAAIIILFLGTAGMMVQPSSPSAMVSQFVPLKECAYEVGVKFAHVENVQKIEQVLNQYWEQDLKRETIFEVEFEKLTHIDVNGDYTIKDLELVKFFFERTYGFNVSKYAFTRYMTFLPPDAELKYIDAIENRCANQTFAGLSRSVQKQIFLMSSTEIGQKQFLKNLSHEFTHQIHFKAGMFTDFNEQWDKIQGGYARRYGTNNIKEDVATVVEAAVVAFLEGKDVNTIKPIDGNYEAFHAKLRLLKKYHFLLPALVVR